MTFAKQLLEIMEDKDIDVRFISQRFGISKLTIYRWLGMETEPHPALAKVLLKELKKIRN